MNEGIAPRAATAWLVLGALALAVPFASTLSAPFDFVDDGCLVYREPGPLLPRVWRKSVAEFHHRGPFRPVTWLHWEAAATLFGDTPLPHRVLHLAGTTIMAGLLLAFLRDLGIPPWPAWLAAAASLWGPFRSELHFGLGITEAFGGLYALAALIAATRAARLTPLNRWDAAAWLFALLAIGCKNTFAAVVPAMMALRVLAGDQPWRAGLTAALTLGTVLLFPVAHAVAFKLDPTPKEYATSPPTFGFALAWLRALARAGGVEYFGLPVLLAVLVGRRTTIRRATLAAAVALMLFGVAVYLPVGAISGRYTLPAAWGVDLFIAVVLADLITAPPGLIRWATLVAFAFGLAVALGTTLDRGNRYAARSDMLWQAATYLEDNAPSESRVAWIGVPLPRGDELGVGEGVHFAWHLEHRGRRAIVLDAANQDFAVTGPAAPPPGGPWSLVRTFSAPYRFGFAAHRCHLWRAAARPTPARIAHR